MSEEADHGVGSVVMEDEHRSDGGNVIEIQEQVVSCSESFCSPDNWKQATRWV